MGKIKMRNKLVLGILTLSSLSSLGKGFIKNLYLKNNSELRLKHEKKEVENVAMNSSESGKNEKEFTYKANNNINIGTLVGKNKDLFIFLGGQIDARDVKKDKGKITGIDGKLNVGVSYKKKVNENVEITFNSGYQYMGGMEENIKEGLKLRGLWDKKYDDDEKARKEFYHSQGLRLKNDEVLASGVLDLNYEKTKAKLGLIYSSETLVAGKGRIESFLELDQKISKLNIGINLNHKLKTDFEIVDRLGRLKGDVTLSSKLGNFEIMGKAYTNIGSIIRSYKNRTAGGENSLSYEKGGLSFKSILNHETLYDYSKNKKSSSENGEKHSQDKTEKLLYKQEFLTNLVYKDNKVEINSENKVKGKVFTNTNGTVKVDNDKYKRNGSDNNNKDFTVFSAYTKNEIEVKAGYVNLRFASRYRYNMELDDSSKLTHNHLALVGLGLTFENKTNKLNLKNSVDARYLISHSNNTNYSVISAWTDNKLDYEVNDKLRLMGELNFTSFNKVKILEKEKIEILGLGDVKGKIESKLSEKVDFVTELGLNTIILFDYKDKGNNFTQKVSSDNTQNNSNSVLTDLLLKNAYNYKGYIKNSLSYKLNKGMKITGNLGMSYISFYDSDKLYSVLKDIKRKQIDENGIVGISEDESKKINDEKKEFGEKSLEIISIQPGIEGEFKFLDDELVIKPKLGVAINLNKNINYKSTSAKATLNIDYRW